MTATMRAPRGMRSPLSAVRVALAVPALVVVVDDGVGVHQEADALADLAARVAVLLDDRVFLRRQLAGLLEDGVRDDDLSHVVQRRAEANDLDLARGQGKLLGDDPGVLRQAAAVAAGVGVAALDGLGERQRGVEGEAGEGLALADAADGELGLTGEAFQARELLRAGTRAPAGSR